MRSVLRPVVHRLPVRRSVWVELACGHWRFMKVARVVGAKRLLCRQCAAWRLVDHASVVQ